ncbi:MAG TPA: hypothetical protein VHZ07_08480 [Bryobacteraceae bacterium]|jgi:hypothetical protein|nr:hypothetical protein [Bryobacteraceae bacterium]
MNEDYLWDREGEPKPDIVRLERLLGELRWSHRPIRRTMLAQWWRRKTCRTMAAAAVTVLCLGGTYVVQRTQMMHPETSWQLSLAGRKPSAVRAGQVIETAAATGATMESESVGEVDIKPDSRLRLMAAYNGRQQLALDRGTIHAFIWAPPTKFVVDTPSAKTVDLGCQYTLSVGADGTGFLTVEMGWVAFQWRNIESFIPAGAACTTRPGHGPNTPYFLDAPRALTKGLAEFDLTGNTQALNMALASARPRDGLTLWHLLQRTQGQERAEVFDRFAKLVKLPSNLTREGILSGDQKSMDAAWDALDLGDTSWWREWKRQW